MAAGLTLNKITSQKGINIGEATLSVGYELVGVTDSWVRQHKLTCLLTGAL